MIVPPIPTPIVTLPTFATGPRRSVSSGVSIRRTATTSTQNRMLPATSENAASTCSASIHSLKPTRGSYEVGRRSAWRRLSGGKTGLREQKPQSRRDDAEDQAVPVVRYRRRGGGEVLHVDLPRLEDRGGHALRLRGAAGGGDGDDRLVRARRAGVRGAERRAGLHVQRGDLARGRLRDAGR